MNLLQRCTRLPGWVWNLLFQFYSLHFFPRKYLVFFSERADGEFTAHPSSINSGKIKLLSGIKPPNTILLKYILRQGIILVYEEQFNARLVLETLGVIIFI